jgi:hypothetical protein
VGAFVTASTAGDSGDAPAGVFFALLSPWVLIVSAQIIDDRVAP